MRIARRPEAKHDLVERADYIAQRNPGAAERFLAAAERDIQQLARMPEMGPKIRFNHPELQDLRFWPIRGFHNFLIFYRPTQDGIELIRVLHGAQDLESVFAGE